MEAFFGTNVIVKKKTEVPEWQQSVWGEQQGWGNQAGWGGIQANQGWGQ